MDLICFSNAIGYFFENVDSAFKNSTIFMFLVGILFPLVTVIGGTLITAFIDKSKKKKKIVYWIVLLISPFNTLSEGLNNCVFNGFIKAGPE